MAASQESAADELLEAVRDTAGDDYEVFGEIARSPDGAVAYLARDLADQSLVALRVEPDPRSRDAYLLEVAKQLDSSVPAPADACPRCAAALRSWGRFCTKCGLDLWTGPAPGHKEADAHVLAAVKEAARGRYEVLGEMHRADGSGFVFFARELQTGRVEALRLRQEAGQQYSIGVTQVLQRAVEAPDPKAKAPRRQRS
jgi:hypothetical protein